MGTRLPRKLAAILYADVAGYARLTGADEDATHRLLREYLGLIATSVEQHRGQVMHYAGDAVLARFDAVVDALAAAVQMQAVLGERNTSVPDERRVQFRVGVNLGDVIEDQGDMYGDGVNVAARLESLADVGGICISESVRVAIGNKLDLDYEFMGAQPVKNITEAVRTYRVLPAGVTGTAAQASEVTVDHHDKPSIAVLPFDNMSGDPDQEYFGDGIAEDIITMLSRMPWFFVIARNTSFTYKGKAHNIAAIAEELGVQYVLEGSVRKSGSRVRITAQFIDAASGNHVWADRYDRELADVFAVQDEVVENIVGAIAPEFLSAEARRAQRARPEELNAWDCVMRGRWHMWRLARLDFASARPLFERAIELVPSGEFGASDLALIHVFEGYYNWNESRSGSFAAALKRARQAVAANDHDPWAHANLALSRLFMLEWDEALASADRAIELAPNFAPGWGIRCLALAVMDCRDDALDAFAEARRLSPHDNLMPVWLVGVFWAHWTVAAYADALAAVRENLRLVPDNPTARRQLAACYTALGDMDKGRQAMQEYLQLEPDHTAADIKGLPSRNPAHLQRFIDFLCEAGLPR